MEDSVGHNEPEMEKSDLQAQVEEDPFVLWMMVEKRKWGKGRGSSEVKTSGGDNCAGGNGPKSSLQILWPTNGGVGQNFNWDAGGLMMVLIWIGWRTGLGKEINVFLFGDTEKERFEQGECVALEGEFQGKKPPDNGLEKFGQAIVGLTLAMEGIVKELNSPRTKSFWGFHHCRWWRLWMQIPTNMWGIEASGFAGDIWVLWNVTVTVDILSLYPQVIHMGIHSDHNSINFLCLIVYASPKVATRLSL
ncbi:hypothetical protein GOBAR_DD24690 [Gossypium barbadense]|nr:hypothetical protein GOBAR_DD24690 [Gossypium barbadense]